MHPGLLLQSPGHPSVCHASLDGCMLDMQAHSVDMRRALNASGLAVAMPGTHFSGSGQPSWLHASTCKRIQQHAQDAKRIRACCCKALDTFQCVMPA